MKVVYVTARQPYPYYKGDQWVSYNQIKQLSKNHEVYLISYYEEDYHKLNEEMAKYCTGMLLMPNSGGKKVVSSFKTVVNGHSIQSNLFYQKSKDKKIRQYVEQVSPDVVHVLSFRMAEYFIQSPCNKTLGLVDAYSHNMELRMAGSKGLRRLLWACESKLLKRYEERIVRYYNYCTLVSERDLQLID